MDNINNKITARFNSKKTWVTLWFFAAAGLLLSLRALSLIKPKTSIALCAAALVFSAAGTLVGVYASRASLDVEEKFVCFKNLFGKRIYLPFDAVTGVKTTLFDTVCIFAPSCRIRCHFVKNKDEIVSAIKEKIQDRKK